MGQNQTSQANSRPRTPIRFNSAVPTPMSVHPAEYNTRATSSPPYMDNSFNHSDMSILSRGSYPGSPSPSMMSMNSTSTASQRSNFEMNDFYNSRMEKYICPMQGCLYSVLGFSTSEELDQHMALLSHFPEPSTVVNPQMVTILDTDSAFETPEDWLALQQDGFDEPIYTTPPPTYNSPPPTYEFTFTYDQKKQFPPSSPASVSPAVGQCDCQHCQLQNSRNYPTMVYPTKRAKSTATKRKTSLYDIPTPLTIQMPPPPTIINLPPPPPPPTSNPSKVTKTSSTSANLNQYAIWQQQIQIAQVAEMLQAQQKQRDAQRRKLEADTSSGVHVTPQSGYTILREQDSSLVYGYPRPSYPPTV